MRKWLGGFQGGFSDRKEEISPEKKSQKNQERKIHMKLALLRERDINVGVIVTCDSNALEHQSIATANSTQPFPD